MPPDQTPGHLPFPATSEGNLAGKASSVTDGPIKIDKGIPVPSRHSREGRLEFPFGDMDVGESFFVTQVTVSTLLSHARKAKPRRFTMRSMIEGGVRGTRVWRIE